MSDYGKMTSKDTVRLERLLPGPIERVWAYLTESDKRAQWLAAGEMELRVGGKVELKFFHADLTPHEEAIPQKYQQLECGHGFTGIVTLCEPPSLLAYTWGGEQSESEVKFELSVQGEKVLLVITHSRLCNRDERTSVASGWHAHTNILEARLSGQTPPPFWAEIERLEQEYSRRFSD